MRDWGYIGIGREDIFEVIHKQGCNLILFYNPRAILKFEAGNGIFVASTDSSGMEEVFTVVTLLNILSVSRRFLPSGVNFPFGVGERLLW